MEIPYDGIDQDGDGMDLVDVDGDGWPSRLAFGLDCNDRDASVHPGAWDFHDAIDQDCDGDVGELPPLPVSAIGGGLLGLEGLLLLLLFRWWLVG